MELQVNSIQIFSDSNLVVEQVSGEFQARDEGMVAYLSKVREELKHFPHHTLVHIDHEANTNADALAKLATVGDADLIGTISVELLENPSISPTEPIATIDQRPSWMEEIITYLKEDRLPENREAAQRVRYHAEHYLMQGDRLYKRGISTPLLRCLDPEEAQMVLHEIHEGVCGNHTGGSP